METCCEEGNSVRFSAEALEVVLTFKYKCYIVRFSLYHVNNLSVASTEDKIHKADLLTISKHCIPNSNQ